MKRPGPPKRSQPPRRRKRLRARSARRSADATARSAVRERVFERDQRCRLEHVEGAGECAGRLTPHHVRKSSQGGAYDESNLVAMCASHNDRIESDADLAALARSMGLVIRRGDNPNGGTMRYRITIDVDVNDELLAEHDGDQKPPPNDVEDWYGTDLIEAVNDGIAEVEHAECVSIEKLQ